MRWEKGEYYVEILSAVSADEKGAVWYVRSNLGLENLPIEWRAQFPKADEEAYRKLEASVSGWAEHKGYQLVANNIA